MKVNFLKAGLLSFGLAIVGIGGVELSQSSTTNDMTKMQLAYANAEAGANTGPAQIVDCAMWGTGDRKVCMSTNTNPCTESDCQ